MTVNGTFCLAKNYEQFLNNCKNAAEKVNITTDWIVANPFDGTFSNEMIQNATNYTKSRISGLIFISDTDISAQRRYNDPKMISRISFNATEQLLSYSFSASDEGVRSPVYIGSIEHHFSQKCYVFDNLLPLLDISTVAFMIMFLVWVMLVYNLRKEQSFPV